MSDLQRVLADLEAKRPITEGIKPPRLRTLGEALVEYGHRCRERAERLRELAKEIGR